MYLVGGSLPAGPTPVIGHQNFDQTLSMPRKELIGRPEENMLSFHPPACFPKKLQWVCSKEPKVSKEDKPPAPPAVKRCK